MKEVGLTCLAGGRKVGTSGRMPTGITFLLYLLTFQLRRQAAVQQAFAKRQQFFPGTTFYRRLAFGMDDDAQLLRLFVAMMEYGDKTLDHPLKGIHVVIEDDDVGGHILPDSVVHQDVFFFLPLGLSQRYMLNVGVHRQHNNRIGQFSSGTPGFFSQLGNLVVRRHCPTPRRSG